MAQERITIDGWGAVQPETFDWNFETTSTQDSGRAMSGTMYDTPMFTVESFAVKYNELTISQASALLQALVKRPSKPYFSLHYFSPYYGTWRTAQFSVSTGSLRIKTLKNNREKIKEITCNFVGREPI